MKIFSDGDETNEEITSNINNNKFSSSGVHWTQVLIIYNLLFL